MEELFVDGCAAGLWLLLALPFGAVFVLAGIGKIVTSNGILSSILFFLFGMPAILRILASILIIIIKLIGILLLTVELIAIRRSARKTRV
jgi:hypothetical protein